MMPMTGAQILVHALPLPVHGARDELRPDAPEPLEPDEEHVRERRLRALARGTRLALGAAAEAPDDGVSQGPSPRDELVLGDPALDGDTDGDHGKGHDQPHGAAAVAHDVE
jgi:hypothetical protein